MMLSSHRFPSASRAALYFGRVSFSVGSIEAEVRNHSTSIQKHTNDDQPRIAIVGGGITGIATAHYLVKHHGLKNLTVLEQGSQAMSFTSAQSGENYRNWWPHPTMIQFTNRSIDLMEEFVKGGDNRIDMSRRGYVLATRHEETLASLVDELLKVQQQQQNDEVANGSENEIRFHDGAGTTEYQSPATHGIRHWDQAPAGIDVVTSREILENEFPTLDVESLAGVVHIRRGGDISGHRLGSIMLDSIRKAGATISFNTAVKGITYDQHAQTFALDISNSKGSEQIYADYLVNAAGPMANSLVQMLDPILSLPIKNIYHQKLAFEDHLEAVPRNLPFCIDLDSQCLDWTAEERESLAQEEEFRYLLEEFPGSIHCRPDGHSATGKWIKLGWAFNEDATDPTNYQLLHLEDQPSAIMPSQATLMNEWFPEIVLRGAARLHPNLKRYYDGKLPHHRHHYGGWYSMTEENWPLIGPLLGNDKKEAPFGGRVFVNCAPSGFGTMTACASGELCAAWIANHSSTNNGGHLTAGLPEYAESLSLKRYDDKELMKELREADKGLL